MKKVFATIIILSCIVQFACKKKTTTGIGYSVQPPKGLDTLVSLSATVSGQNWKADVATAYKQKSVIDSNNITLLVTASKQGTPASTVTFNISNYSGPKTYVIDPPAVSATYYLGNQRHYATTGQIIIGSDDAYGIIGVFNFVADSTSVSEGSFNVAQP